MRRDLKPETILFWPYQQYWFFLINDKFKICYSFPEEQFIHDIPLICLHLSFHKNLPHTTK